MSFTPYTGCVSTGWTLGTWYRVSEELPMPDRIVLNSVMGPARLLIVLEDGSAGFAELDFRYTGAQWQVRFSRSEEGKEGPERHEYRLQDVIAWMDVAPPPERWFKSEGQQHD